MVVMMVRQMVVAASQMGEKVTSILLTPPSLLLSTPLASLALTDT